MTRSKIDDIINTTLLTKLIAHKQWGSKYKQ